MEKNFNFDLLKIFKYYNLTDNLNCEHLNQDWLGATFEFNDFEMKIINDLHNEIVDKGEYMNEDELKIKMVSLLFYVSNIQEHRKISVFYERSLSGVVNDVHLSVICDCLVATPLVKAPDMPYFFLQEAPSRPSPKGKENNDSEKKDPEAQMLIAMLIAQAKNNDEKPIYGGYLIGTGWHFTTLIGKDYCVSKKYEASTKEHLLGIICALKNLKQLILNR